MIKIKLEDGNYLLISDNGDTKVCHKDEIKDMK